MRQLLREVKDGTFTKNWIKENETGPNGLKPPG